MLVPDFSRLSLTTPTAGPGDAPGAAADAVMSSHALIASILYNIRYGDVPSVCEAVTNWCSVSNAHHQACDENFNPAFWKELAERCFPNLRQEVFPPLNNPEIDPFLERREILDGDLTKTDLPWSGSLSAMSWKAWLLVLCEDYLRKRERFRQDVAAKKGARDKSKRDARMRQEQLDDFEARLESAHFAGGPPNQRILHSNEKKLRPYRNGLAQASQERKSAADQLQHSRQRLSYHRQRYGRTADHRKHDPRQRLPAYRDTRGGGEDGPGAMNGLDDEVRENADTRGGGEDGPGAKKGFDDEVRENADTEEQWSNDTAGEDGADEKWGERYSDVAMSEAEDDDDDDGVDGEAQ